MTKRVRGYFVILIKQFDDTMFGAEYHYTPWCIAENKYCRFHRTDRIRKFDSYDDALQHINKIRPTNSHDRDYEIAYLTYSSANMDELNCWVQIKNEMQAIAHDQQQDNDQKERTSSHVPQWDSTQFSSLFKNRTE